MTKCANTSVSALIEHQQTIKRSLADFAIGVNTAHLSGTEIEEVVRGLNERLTVINERLVSITR